MHFFDEDLKSPCHFRRFQFRSFTPNKLHPKLAQLLRSFSFSLIPACTSRSAQKIHTIKVWKRGISGSPIALCKGETSSFPLNLEESPTKVWPESFWPRLQHFGVGFSKKISKVFQKAETTKKKKQFPPQTIQLGFFFWALSEIRPPQSLPSHRKDVTRPLIEGFMRSLRRWRKPRRRCARICSFTGFPAWKLWRQKSQGFTACFRRFFCFSPFAGWKKKPRVAEVKIQFGSWIFGVEAKNPRTDLFQSFGDFEMAPFRGGRFLALMCPKEPWVSPKKGWVN